jgi:hypothetical protein
MFLAGAAIGGPKSCNKCEHTNDFFYGVSDLEIVSRYVFLDTRKTKCRFSVQCHSLTTADQLPRQARDRHTSKTTLKTHCMHVCVCVCVCVFGVCSSTSKTVDDCLVHWPVSQVRKRISLRH